MAITYAAWLQQKKHPLWQQPILFLLFLLSLIYMCFLLLRRFPKKRYHPKEGKVIALGNIIAGGTGKTPLALFLAKHFLEQGKKVALILRGYKGTVERQKHSFIVPEYDRDVFFFGDEACLLKEELPNALVIVGKDRKKSLQIAQHLGATLFILDDALQNKAIQPDLTLALIHANNPLGGGYFLPRGLLRDFPSRLNTVDAIITDGPFKYKNVPIIQGHMKFSGFFSPQGEEARFLSNKAALFAAIAHPHRFQKSVEQEGLHVIDTLFLEDHSHFSEKELSFFAEQAHYAGAEFLLCTQKDKVKLNPSLSLTLPIFWMKVSWEFDVHQSRLLALLEQNTL